MGAAGLGLRIDVGDFADGPSLLAGAPCYLGFDEESVGLCRASITALDEYGFGVLSEAQHHFTIAEFVQFGVGFAFVGDLGGEGPAVVAKESSLWHVLRSIPATPLDLDTTTPIVSVQPFPAWRYACGDVTGDGLDDLCEYGSAGFTAYAAPLQAMAEPELEITGPVEAVAMGRFTNNEAGLVMANLLYDEGRGAVYYRGVTQDSTSLDELTPRWTGLPDQDALGLGDTLGVSMDSGDLDGDGDDDLVVGADLHDNRRGRVWVLTDAPDDPIGVLALELLGSPDRRGQFGFRTLIHDLNSDGAPDLVVAEPGSALESATPGRVHIFPGPLESMSWDNHVTWRSAVEYGDTFGYELAAGDIDEDGIQELYVAAPYDGEAFPNAGAVYQIVDPLNPPDVEQQGVQ